MNGAHAPPVPRAGMLATVRNRRAVVAGVEPFDAGTGRLHLVHLEYADDRAPAAERLLWELEPRRHLEEPNALPDPAHAGGPMDAADFDALLRAARWTALSPYVGLDPASGDGRARREIVASPFHGGVRIESYQLVPLLKALRMPRVNLLVADDVGLGKTVEAGLILTELLLRRRIRRVLVLTPASLRRQWREELWEKFSLRFQVVDRQETERLRRRLGMDATPWRSFSRIVASFHYLRQPDVLEEFLAACRTPEDSPHLPWDLLIVDECHHLMPSPFGEDSELCRMLRVLAPRFEHRLFLSATPHNGHTRSFTGLLEMLDPVRFTRTSEMTPAMRGRVEDVVVRRLKRDINARSAAPRFCTRHPPRALPLAADPREVRLSEAFDAFRTAVRALVSAGSTSRRRAGAFAVEILGKRLLSCPTAFAESWRRARQGFAGREAAPESELAAAARAVRQETGDDREAQEREATAATVVGAWLRNFAAAVGDEIREIERALEALGFDLDGAPITEQTPAADARFDALVALIERLLRGSAETGGDGNGFVHSERLIVFTEYKTTLDYLARRLRERYPAGRVLTLFGSGGPEGMDETGREHVKTAFNDPAARVRVLVATDAASEGLNLHRTARYLLHYDCPWNPSRLEQRNGRIDRYGQARDVTVHHFASATDPDLRFLAHVVRKVDEIREDLGSVNDVFDRAAHRRLVRGEDAAAVREALDRGIAAARGSADLAPEAAGRAAGEAADEEAREAAEIEAVAGELDIAPGTLRDTLEAALAIPGGRPQLQDDEQSGFSRLLHPDLAGWRDVIDESVRRPAPGGGHGPLPRLAFSTEPFLERLGSLSVFRPREDALLVHLAHPLMQRALGVLARRRYPGTGNETSRWTVRRGPVPPGADALVFLSLEEVAVNELRETFHRWVRTLALPVRDGRLGEPPADELEVGLRAEPARNPGRAPGGVGAQSGAAGRAAARGADRRAGARDRGARSGAPGGAGARTGAPDMEDRARAADIFEGVLPDLKRRLRRHGDDLTQRLRRQLAADGEAARTREDERYRQRQGELSALIEQSTLARLTREVEALSARMQQRRLFDDDEGLAELERSAEEKQEELRRRRRHHEDIREQLQRERKRILEHLLPARFALAGRVQVFPVTVEIRLPERARPEAPIGTTGGSTGTLHPEEREWLNRYRQVLAERYPGVAVSLVLYGSKARGDAREDSDLDVLLIVKNGAAHLKRRLRYVGHDLAAASYAVPSILVFTEEEWEDRGRCGSPFEPRWSVTGCRSCESRPVACRMAAIRQVAGGRHAPRARGRPDAWGRLDLPG